MTEPPAHDRAAEERRAALTALGMELPEGATHDELEAAIAYVRGQFWPPLPRVYGAWLIDLKYRATGGAAPDLELAVPPAILDSGYTPRSARRRRDGTTVITLFNALASLRQEELLMPPAEEDEPDPLPEGVELVTPIVALVMANSADAATFGELYDPEEVARVAAELAHGTWVVDADQPIHVDHQGRITTGLNTLLAVVQADISVPVPIVYGYDTANRPLTWRGPAGWNHATERPA